MTLSDLESWIQLRDSFSHRISRCILVSFHLKARTTKFGMVIRKERLVLEGGGSIFGTSYIRPQDMINSNQTLHGDKDEREVFTRSPRTWLWQTKFLSRMLTRDLFAVVNLLVSVLSTASKLKATNTLSFTLLSANFFEIHDYQLHSLDSRYNTRTSTHRLAPSGEYEYESFVVA